MITEFDQYSRAVKTTSMDNSACFRHIVSQNVDLFLIVWKRATDNKTNSFLADICSINPYLNLARIYYM